MRLPLEVDMATKPTKNAPVKKRTASQMLYEKKIEAYRETMHHYEQQCAAMEYERSALLKEGLVGLAVTHKTFGAGTIIEKERQMITVQFVSDNKRFILPAAFTEGFLSTADDTIHHEIARYRDLGEQIRMIRDQMSGVRRSIGVLEAKL